MGLGTAVAYHALESAVVQAALASSVQGKDLGPVVEDWSMAPFDLAFGGYLPLQSHA